MMRFVFFVFCHSRGAKATSDWHEWKPFLCKLGGHVTLRVSELGKVTTQPLSVILSACCYVFSSCLSSLLVCPSLMGTAWEESLCSVCTFLIAPATEAWYSKSLCSQRARERERRRERDRFITQVVLPLGPAHIFRPHIENTIHYKNQSNRIRSDYGWKGLLVGKWGRRKWRRTASGSRMSYGPE